MLLGIRDFQINPPFERLACLYVTITGNFERFQYFNFKTNFLKNKNLFLVQSTTLENAIFPYKTALSETNVNTNKNAEYKMNPSQRTGFGH